MSPDEKFGRLVIGAFFLGVAVALVNSAVDVFFDRLGVPTASTFLNDLIIGAAAGLLAYIWMSRQNAKNELELSTQKRLEEAVHLDRKRIALELHDSVCQTQTGAIMHMECAGDSLDENAEAKEQVTRALHLVRVSMSEMRCALWDLYPEELQKADLKSAIETLVKDLTSGNGLHVKFSFSGITRRLPPETEKGLLRISQEAVSNVVKHAQAHELQIELFLDPHRARLCVKDDGRGFQPDQVLGSFGLTSMENRTSNLGGIWKIRSEPGRGTEVQAWVPIPAEKG